MTATHAEAISDAAASLREAGIEDAHLEAEVLLAHAGGVRRTRLLAMLANGITPTTSASYQASVNRRLQHEPLAYITGRREFYGIDIICDRRALIPRPETEMLVDVALEELEQRGRDLRIVDVGTGSGAIAIAIAVTNPDAQVLALDASAEALALAAENATALGASGRIDLRESDLLERASTANIVLANLPYVAMSDWGGLPPEIKDWEPEAALVGGERGTEVIERLLAQAPPHVASGGLLALEVGAGQAHGVIASARASFPAADIHARTDLAGIERIVVVRAP